MSPDMMAQLSSPETIAMVQRMMQDMPAEDVAATMRQAGLDVTPEQAQQMQAQVWRRMLPRAWATSSVQLMLASADVFQEHECKKVSGSQGAGRGREQTAGNERTAACLVQE